MFFLNYPYTLKVIKKKEKRTMKQWHIVDFDNTYQINQTQIFRHHGHLKWFRIHTNFILIIIITVLATV